MSYSEKKSSESASLSEKGQMYRLKKIDKLEKFLCSKVAWRDSLNKRCKRRAPTINDTLVITTITTLQVDSVLTLTTGIRMPVIIELASTGLFLGVSLALTHKTQKVFDSKAKNTRRSRF